MYCFTLYICMRTIVRALAVVSFVNFSLYSSSRLSRHYVICKENYHWNYLIFLWSPTNPTTSCHKVFHSIPLWGLSFELQSTLIIIICGPSLTGNQKRVSTQPEKKHVLIYKSNFILIRFTKNMSEDSIKNLKGHNPLYKCIT